MPHDSASGGLAFDTDAAAASSPHAPRSALALGVIGALGEELLAGATAGWQRQVPRILWVLRWVVPAIVAVVLAFSLRGTLAAVAEFFGGGVPFQPG